MAWAALIHIKSLVHSMQLSLLSPIEQCPGALPLCLSALTSDQHLVCHPEGVMGLFF
jgi:hypothetical protein